VKHGVFVTPDKRIQVATIERETEEHHKFDRIIAYTREQIVILQQVVDFTFGIGARVRHPKAKPEQDKAGTKCTTTNLATFAIGHHVATCPMHLVTVK
jgi:hypothetical protein